MGKIVGLVDGELKIIHHEGKVSFDYAYRLLDIEIIDLIRIPNTDIYLMCDDEGLLKSLEGTYVYRIHDKKTGFTNEFVGNLLIVNGVEEDLMPLDDFQQHYMSNHIKIDVGMFRPKE